MAQIIGGPQDGKDVSHWSNPFVVAPDGNGRWSCYERTPSGDYRYEGTRDESELKKVEPEG